MKARPSLEKRRKELQRQERQKEKAEQRAQRKAAARLNPETGDDDLLLAEPTHELAEPNREVACE